MMLAVKLAFRNLVGAKLRTWLNIIILSMSYLMIIWISGMYAGWNRQAIDKMVAWETGKGQYWQNDYDPYDLFTFEDSHAPIQAALTEHALSMYVAPVLVTQAIIYPQGRMQNIILKGIAPEQNVLALPTEILATESGELPVLIGTRMAKDANLQKDDYVTIRWRDVNGVYDATDAKIVGLMKTDVPAVDQGQFWVPLDRLQKMLDMPGEATLIVLGQHLKKAEVIKGWKFRDLNYLTKDMIDLMAADQAGARFIYIILLALALLAVFDTQMLSIFRRRKEIGTMIALGMTRKAVIGLFTIEGAMHGALAAIMTAVYGIPLLALQAHVGIPMPEFSDGLGIASINTIYPVYGLGLLAGTLVIVMVAVTIVSYIPARRISHLKPTDALRGKLN